MVILAATLILGITAQLAEAQTLRTETMVYNEGEYAAFEAGNNNIEITVQKGNWIRINQYLYNTFNSEWVNTNVRYQFTQGGDLISRLSTTNLDTFWTSPSDSTCYEFQFEASQTGTVVAQFQYDGDYHLKFNSEKAHPYSSGGTYSTITIHIQDNSLPIIPIILAIVAIAIAAAATIGALIYTKKLPLR
jgi:hypothetical protein